VTCSRQLGPRDRYVVRAWRIAALRSSTGVPRRFGDIPLGSCCGRSFHDLRIEFPRGLGVIQVCAQAVASGDRSHRFRFDLIDRLADCAVPRNARDGLRRGSAHGHGRAARVPVRHRLHGRRQRALTKRYTLCARIAIASRIGTD
jgi:hypothetical protein